MAIDLPQPIVFGDTSGGLDDHADGSDQTISLAANVGTRTLIGDANSLLEHAIGGADALTGFAIGASTVIGDAITISDHAQGGDDHVVAGASGQADALGDAVTQSGHAQGGKDFVEADSDFSANAYGDASLMTDHARGGNDVVTGTNGHGLAVLYGDAQTFKRLCDGWQ